MFYGSSGGIGVKVTAFLKTYVNVSYRARSRRRSRPQRFTVWLTVKVSPIFPPYRAEDRCLLSLFLSILYRRAAFRFVCTTWAAECSSRVRHRTDRGLHPWYPARSRPSDAHESGRTYLRKRDYARLRDAENGVPYVYTTVYTGQRSTSDGITAFSPSWSHSLLRFRGGSSCKLHTPFITLVLTRAVSLEKTCRSDGGERSSVYVFVNFQH